MAAITFSKDPQKGWVVAGWVMRQILDDVLSQHPDDSEMAEAFDLAKLTSGISVESLKPEFADRVTSAFRQTATGVLSRTIRSGIHDQPYGDARTIAQYREALEELLKAIPLPQGHKSA